MALLTDAQSYELRSPDLKNRINISITESIKYTVSYNEVELICPSYINMRLENNTILG